MIEADLIVCYIAGTFFKSKFSIFFSDKESMLIMSDKINTFQKKLCEKAL